MLNQCGQLTGKQILVNVALKANLIPLFEVVYVCRDSREAGISSSACGIASRNDGREIAMHPLLCLAMLAAGADPTPAAKPLLLKPARVFDGIDPKPHDGWG